MLYYLYKDGLLGAKDIGRYGFLTSSAPADSRLTLLSGTFLTVRNPN